MRTRSPGFEPARRCCGGNKSYFPGEDRLIELLPIFGGRAFGRSLFRTPLGVRRLETKFSSSTGEKGREIGRWPDRRGRQDLRKLVTLGFDGDIEVGVFPDAHSDLQDGGQGNPIVCSRAENRNPRWNRDSPGSFWTGRGGSADQLGRLWGQTKNPGRFPGAWRGLTD